MLGAGAHLVLFLSSYAPLLGLLAGLETFGSGWPSWVCGGVAAVSVALLLVVWRLAARGAVEALHLVSSRGRDGEVASYFVSYVVPFAVVDVSLRTRIAVAAFAVLLAALYLRAAIFYIHPLLLLAGVHVFDAVSATGIPVTVLTRRRFLRQEQSLWVTALAPNVYLERAQEPE